MIVLVNEMRPGPTYLSTSDLAVWFNSKKSKRIETYNVRIWRTGIIIMTANTENGAVLCVLGAPEGTKKLEFEFPCP